MLKRISQYIKTRREQKLRMWCMKLAAQFHPDYCEGELERAANEIYQWIKKAPQSKGFLDPPNSD